MESGVVSCRTRNGYWLEGDWLEADWLEGDGLKLQCFLCRPAHVGVPSTYCYPWSAEKMPDGQRQRVDMPELLTRASRRKDWKRFLLNRPSCPPDDPIGRGTELNCLLAVTRLCSISWLL